MERSILFGWTGLRRAMSCLVVLGLVELAALPVLAGREDEARPALAPPGRCAEPRAAVDARTGDDFSVVGPVAELFDPIDVAAGPAIEGDSSLRLPMPSARPMARPGACDQPGAACGAQAPSTVVIEPPPGGGNSEP